MECHFQVLSEPMETECSEPMEYSDADGAGDTVETPSSSQADTNDTQELPCEDLPKTNTVSMPDWSWSVCIWIDGIRRKKNTTNWMHGKGIASLSEIFVS